MQVETVPIATLVADPANARKHAPKNLEAIKGSLTKFDQQKPIVVDRKGVVVAGNGTMEAARQLGWKELQVVRTELEGAEAIAFAIADNRTGELAEWDAGVLSETLKSLQDMDFDLGAIGFDEKDLQGMIASEEPTEGLTDADEVPEDVETRCKPGDIWTLGKHRLLCGDSTNVQHVERLMGGEKADICFTSPPYNAGRKPMQSERKNGGIQHDKYETYDDHQDQDGWLRLVSDSLTLAMTVSAYQLFNVQHLAGNKVALIDWLHRYRNHLVDTVIWDKQHGVPQMAEKVLNSRFEYVFIFSADEGPSKAVATATFSRNVDNVYSGSRQTDNEYAGIHAATFPVHLPEFFAVNFTPPKGSVVDLFCGTGTTLIACEKTGRRCFGMELDPHYCSVILARWEAFTGQKAVRAGTDENTES